MLSGVGEEENHAISFFDPYFEQAVRQSINKLEGEILVSDVQGLTELSISSFGGNIKSIEGIQYFKDLQRLDIYNQPELHNISPVAELTKLRYLYITEGKIVDISPLEKLVNLQDLSLRNNQISDISVIANFIKLRQLDLSNNKIADITPLSGLNYLFQLTLSGNLIEDVSGLESLTDLRYLYLKGNKIVDYSPTSTYYLNLAGKDFSLTVLERIPVTKIITSNELVLTVGDRPVAIQATVYPINATFKTLIWSSSDESIVKVNREGLAQPIGAGTATITVSSIDENKTATVQITVLGKKVDASYPNQSIYVNQDDFTVIVSKQAEKAKLHFQIQPINGELKVVTAPLIKVESETTLRQVDLVIPKGTLIRSSNDWDGTLPLPTVKSNNSVTISGSPSIKAIIEVGFEDLDLYFDQPVRLVIPGQAGRKVGYMKHGVFTPIERVLTADDLNVANHEIPKDEEAKIDVDRDLVIWTKHFTTFIAYDEKKSNSSDNLGSSSGGSTYYPSTDLEDFSQSNGGTFENLGAKIDIPVNAFRSSFKVVINKVNNTSNLSTNKNSEIASDVYEITKDSIGDFDKAVTITLPFNKSKYVIENYEFGIFWFNEITREWVELDDIQVDLQAGKVSGKVNHFAKFAVLATKKDQQKEKDPETNEAKGNDELKTVVQFNDIKGHWAEKSIIELTSIGAINGLPNGTFKPNNNITRAEFASILVKTLNLDKQSGKIFVDSQGHWAQDAIDTAYSNGIVNGYNETTFGANDPITREQMSAMIVNAFKLKNTKKNITFKDDSNISKWAKEAIDTVIADGIIGGYEDGTIRPKGNATRAEAVTIIVRVLNR